MAVGALAQMLSSAAVIVFSLFAACPEDERALDGPTAAHEFLQEGYCNGAARSVLHKAEAASYLTDEYPERDSRRETPNPS
jgi:hypothetical protein